MALIVQKYGGTSVGTVDRIRNVAAKVKDKGSPVRVFT
jgi:aspartokinase